MYTFITLLPIFTAIQTTAVLSVTRLVDAEFIARIQTILSVGRHAFWIMFENIITEEGVFGGGVFLHYYLNIVMIITIITLIEDNVISYDVNNKHIHILRHRSISYKELNMPVTLISFAWLLLLHNDSHDPSFEFCYVNTMNVSFKSCLEPFRGLFEHYML